MRSGLELMKNSWEPML